jgi:hypothetical protein
MISFSDNPVVAEQQMTAIIYYMTTFGFVDGTFDPREQTAVRQWIRALVDMRVRNMQLGARDQIVVSEKQTAYFERVFTRIHGEIQAMFDEVVAQNERTEDFVLARLRLRCFELFKSFDGKSQETLLFIVDRLLDADGVRHPAEQRFRDELVALLQQREPTFPPPGAAGPGPMQVTDAQRMVGSMAEHPMFQDIEHHFSRDPARLGQQLTRDHQLMLRAAAIWDEQRNQGAGRLAGKQRVQELGGSAFLDGHVYVQPEDGRDRELIVLGDLHGCYSCLKAALLQSDFFKKVAAYRQDPRRSPDVKLIFLGDYVDRGKFSYDGILRSVLQLFVTFPEHVVVLRGNHEYYVDMGDRISAGVAPAEAIATFAPYMPKAMFESYKVLFERMPNMLIAGRTLYVHAGIPRDATLAARWRDLSTLNDPDLRFEMMWSDPANANFVPAELQKSNARFPFGKQQFRAFIEKIGVTAMVRGHEKIDDGFKKIWDDRDFVCINLFSAGGRTNNDLPPNASYRSVTPMALTVIHRGGGATATPWVIEYERYNQPALNGFMRTPPEIEFRA